MKLQKGLFKTGSQGASDQAMWIDMSCTLGQTVSKVGRLEAQLANLTTRTTLKEKLGSGIWQQQCATLNFVFDSQNQLWQTKCKATKK